jgi:hypothetical protein
LPKGHAAQVVQHPFHAEVVLLIVSQLQDVLDQAAWNAECAEAVGANVVEKS